MRCVRFIESTAISCFYLIWITLSILGTVYFNHTFGCQKCKIKGESIQGRMCFPKLDGIRRTDKMFRERAA